MNCLKCGAELREGDVVCQNCGAEIAPSNMRFCRECGAKLDEGAKFCGECGTKVEAYFDTAEIVSKAESVFKDNKDPLNNPNDEEDAARYEQFKPAPKISATKNRSTQSTTYSSSVSVGRMITAKSNKSLLIPAAVLVLMAFFISLFSDGSSSSDSSRSSASDVKIPVIDVVAMPYSDAKAALQAAGFTNISSNVDYTADETQWIVIKQSVESGTEIQAGARIELTCAKKCKLYLDISSEYNYIFGSYDISVSLDGEKIGTVPNGEVFTYLTDVLSGTHTLEFCKTGNTSPKNSQKIAVSDNMTYSCYLEHSSSSIYITQETSKGNIDGSALEVIDVTGMVLSDAATILENLGFTNFSSRSSETIWNRANWIVIKQSVAPGTKMDKNDLLELHCISLDKYFSDTYVGKNVIEIQNLAKAGGFSVTFQNSSGSDFNSAVEAMSQDEKADWVATYARQLGSSSRMALVKIKNSKEVEPTATPAPTPKPTPKPTATPKPTTASVPTSTPTHAPAGQTMPVMPGSSLDTALAEAKKFGLSRAYSDEDFGHGTKLCTLTTKNGGLDLDIVYSTSTKEILCGTIVSFNQLSSADEQTAFINAMASVLCPESDKTEVAEWVKSNVGSNAETTISRFVYTVEVGPVGNYLYYAGESNWEEWDSSLG